MGYPKKHRGRRKMGSKKRRARKKNKKKQINYILTKNNCLVQMKEILKIKISAIILFIFPILAILLSLFALNHINSFDQDILPLGKITENKKIECT